MDDDIEDDDIEDDFEYFGPEAGRITATTVLTRFRRGWQHFSPHEWAWRDSTDEMSTSRNVPITAARARELAADRSAWVHYLAVFDASVEHPGAEDRPRTVLRERYDPAVGVLTERFDRPVGAWVTAPTLYHDPRNGAVIAVPWLGDGEEVYDVDAADAQAWLLDTGSDAAFDELGLWAAAEGHDDAEFHLQSYDHVHWSQYVGEQVERYERLWRRRGDRWDVYSPLSRGWRPAGPGRVVDLVPELVGGAVVPPARQAHNTVVVPVRPAVTAAWLAEWPRWWLHWAAHFADGPRDGPPETVLRRSSDPYDRRDQSFESHTSRWCRTSYLHLGRDLVCEADGYTQVVAQPIDWRAAHELVADLYGPYVDDGYPDPPSRMSHRYDTYHRPWK